MVRWMPELIWDERNEAHIARHEVTTDECEEVRRNAPLFFREGLYYYLAGQTLEGRRLVIVLALSGRVITARPATEKERRRIDERSGRR